MLPQIQDRQLAMDYPGNHQLCFIIHRINTGYMLSHNILRQQGIHLDGSIVEHENSAGFIAQYKRLANLVDHPHQHIMTGIVSGIAKDYQSRTRRQIAKLRIRTQCQIFSKINVKVISARFSAKWGSHLPKRLPRQFTAAVQQFVTRFIDF